MLPDVIHSGPGKHTSIGIVDYLLLIGLPPLSIEHIRGVKQSKLGLIAALQYREDLPVPPDLGHSRIGNGPVILLLLGELPPRLPRGGLHTLGCMGGLGDWELRPVLYARHDQPRLFLGVRVWTRNIDVLAFYIIIRRLGLILVGNHCEILGGVDLWLRLLNVIGLGEGELQLRACPGSSDVIDIDISYCSGAIIRGRYFLLLFVLETALIDWWVMRR